MKIKDFCKIYFALFLFQILANVAFCEVTGNLSLNISFSNISTHIVTGLYGMTVTTTTTIPEETTTTTTVARITTTTSTTTTTITTTTSTTTTTITTTILLEIESKNLILDLNKINTTIDEKKAFVKEFIKFDENKAKKTTEKIIKDINIKYELWIENRTNLTVTIFYNGTKKLNNLIIYQYIPKKFANTTKELGIITDEKLRIIEEDPKILFISPSVEKGKEIIIIFSADKRLKKDIIDEFETIVFADNFSLEIDILFFVVPVFLLIIILLVYYIYEKREKEAHYKYSFKRRVSIWFIIKIKIKHLKQKIKDKLKKEEAEFRYQYKV
ncbi:MAG: hypothetical protein QXZ20_01375 [Candidatus Aenigmatarchaeota archaeon]